MVRAIQCAFRVTDSRLSPKGELHIAAQPIGNPTSTSLSSCFKGGRAHNAVLRGDYCRTLCARVLSRRTARLAAVDVGADTGYASRRLIILTDLVSMIAQRED